MSDRPDDSGAGRESDRSGDDDGASPDGDGASSPSVPAGGGETAPAEPGGAVNGPEAFADMTVEQTSLGYAAALALAPGVLVTACYLVGWALLAGTGLPALVAFAAAGVAGAGAMLGYLLYQAWLGGGLLGGAVAYADRPPAVRALALVVGLAAWALAIRAADAALLASLLADAAFGWVPAGLRDPLAAGVGTASGRSSVLVAVATAVAWLVVPAVEELYFRGYLLARLDRLGAGAPVANAALFALYHLWAPWSMPAAFLAILPLAYAVWRTRSALVGVAARVVVGLVAVAGALGVL